MAKNRRPARDIQSINSLRYAQEMISPINQCWHLYFSQCEYAPLLQPPSQDLARCCVCVMCAVIVLWWYCFDRSCWHWVWWKRPRVRFLFICSVCLDICLGKDEKNSTAQELCIRTGVTMFVCLYEGLWDHTATERSF